MSSVAPDDNRVLLINKPLRWTSFDVVNKLRGRLKIRKIGHAGTLDPLATGLLIICTGKMTKQIESFMGMEKEYTGTFVLGKTTPSYDLETEVQDAGDITYLTTEQIILASQALTGTLSQVPPTHSAIRIGGKRAYNLARKGKEVELQPRTVTIHQFEVTSVNLPEVGFRIVCSKGTYIRSIARDLGVALGVGAYLASLCRTRIGSYQLSDALPIESVQPVG